MRKNKLFYYYIKITSILLTLCIGYILSIIIYCPSFYIHEGGHMAYGFFDNTFYGRSSNYKITNWIDCPAMPFLKLPQQIHMIEGKMSLNYIFGGIIAVILFSIFISMYFYKKTRKKIYFLFPIIFVYHELIGNFLCGTDNLKGEPFSICQNLIVSKALYLVIPFLIISISIIIYPKVFKIIRKITK